MLSDMAPQFRSDKSDIIVRPIKELRVSIQQTFSNQIKNKMKTILTSLILTLITISSFGQTELATKEIANDSINKLILEFEKKGIPHFTFRDIPINGPLNQFITQLKKQNFTVINITNKDAILTGKFTGEDVNMLVQASSKSVYGVTVMFDKKDSWKSIKTQYENVKSILTEKYGEPIEVIEKFDDSYYDKSGLQLLALKDDKYTFMVNFRTSNANGMIRLSISNDANLIINYIDAINFLKARSEVFKEY